MIARNVRAAVRANVRVGRGFVTGVRSTLWAPTELLIGDDVKTGSDTRIEVDGWIGDSVLMGNAVAIIGRSDHRMNEVGVPITQATRVSDDAELSLPVRIGSDIWIGFGAIILSGVNIGDHSIVAAGAVVSKDVPSNSIVAGVPARVIGRRFDDQDLKHHRTKLSNQGIRLS